MRKFRIVSGAATRRRDLAMLRRLAQGRGVAIVDGTEDYATIGVMGQESRRVLASLSPDDWSDFPFSTAREVTVAGVACLATRLSYVGELGWELTVANGGAESIFEALIESGAKPMGHYALNCCRIEKGYRHWGHDLGPDITPLEAGLGFVIDWNKSFIGRNALDQQRSRGLTRRLVMMSAGGHPLILHDEPVMSSGKTVGLTTSGAKGARTGLTLALALIAVRPNETLSELADRSYSVRVAGQDYPARILFKPPFDPEGKRMRA